MSRSAAQSELPTVQTDNDFWWVEAHAEATLDAMTWKDLPVSFFLAAIAAIGAVAGGHYFRPALFKETSSSSASLMDWLTGHPLSVFVFVVTFLFVVLYLQIVVPRWRDWRATRVSKRTIDRERNAVAQELNGIDQGELALLVALHDPQGYTIRVVGNPTGLHVLANRGLITWRGNNWIHGHVTYELTTTCREVIGECRLHMVAEALGQRPFRQARDMWIGVCQQSQHNPVESERVLNEVRVVLTRTT